MDKIHLDEAKLEGGQLKLFGMALTKVDEAWAEKMNQVIDWLRELEDFKNRTEGK